MMDRCVRGEQVVLFLGLRVDQTDRQSAEVFLAIRLVRVDTRAGETHHHSFSDSSVITSSKWADAKVLGDILGRTQDKLRVRNPNVDLRMLKPGPRRRIVLLLRVRLLRVRD